MKLKKIISTLLISALTIPCFAGCSSSKDDVPELTWYFGGAEQRDLALVNDKVNEIIKDKIGATVKFVQVDWSSYDQKLNMMISTGEEFDLCYTSPQRNDYYNNVSRNAFWELDELLDEYGKQTRAQIPERLWDATRVNGKIYGVINYQIMATAYGFAVQREMADAAGFEWASIENYKDIEPMLEYVKSTDNTKIPLSYNKASNLFFGALPLFGFDAIGGNTVPGVVRIDDETHTVINQYDTPEFKELIETMRDWYKKGYVKKDAATSEEYASDKAASKFGVLMPEYLANDTTEEDLKPNEPYAGAGVPYYAKKLTPAYITTDRVLATMTAISKTSKHPEKAMQFLELVNTDEELYNLICWGIEDVHWKRVNYTDVDGKTVEVEQIPDSGYAQNRAWMFGNTSNLWLSKHDMPTERWLKINDEAVTTDLLGLSFDSSTVQTEMAACNAVISEYLNSLVSGSVDIDSEYPKFIEKLKVSGADKIIEEKQRQLDEWKKVNGK